MKKKVKTIADFSVRGKVVLLRSDLNSDTRGKKVIFGERIKASLETIKELRRKKARVVIIAHQGQPGKANFLSLRGHARCLNRYVPVTFVSKNVGPSVVSAVNRMNDGDVVLLENVRFTNDEYAPYKKNNQLLKTLVSLSDYYCNDAFSSSHREHTSIVGFPKKLPSFAGRLFERELFALSHMHMHNTLYILGGAKVKDYLPLLTGKHKVLACGLFGQACLLAKGVKLGTQETYLKKEAELTPTLLLQLKRKLKNVETPLDFAVKFNGKRKELSLKDFPNNHEIFDIGSETIKKYAMIIKKSKSVYMKGPPGAFSTKGFSKGTNALLKTLADHKGFVLIGGGHVTDAIALSRISRKRFDHVSLSGGALLRVIAGQKLPGVASLE